jgi:hypothetical protein
LSSLFTLSTGWQRFTANITLPSISGKTIGSSSYLDFQLWVSSSSGLNIVPLQNNTFDFWGVQVEQGSVATPFEQRPIGTELALCQRYYQVIGHSSGYGLAAFCDNTSLAIGVVSFPEMRTAPTVVMVGSFEVRRSGTASTAITSYTASSEKTGARINATTTTANLTAGQGVVITYASGTPTITLSSEL